MRPDLRHEDRARRTSLRLCLLLGAVVLDCTAALAQQLPAARPFLSMGRGFGEQDGAELYANICAACHQPDAKGAVGAAAYPALADNKNLAAADYLLTVVLQGQRGMPPVGRMMSDEQVAGVSNYVRSHFGNSYGEAISAAEVKAARPPSTP